MNPHRFRLALLAGASALVLVAAPRRVFGQTVNYGALEEMYGEPVTTSATGKPQKASEAPADMVIITQDDIRHSGANNIPDILRFVAGIDVRQYNAIDSDVAVNGYNQPFNPRLLVLVNGRQVYLDQFGFVSWAAIPVQLEEIRQIEIVKGPNSALFGFNAASGVINIITYDPLFDNVNSATGRAGTQSLLQGSAVGTAHFGDRGGVRFSVGGLQQDDFKPVGLTPYETTGRRKQDQDGSFNIDSKWQVAPGVQVMLNGSMSTAQYNDMTDIGGMSYDFYHTNSAGFGVAADTALGTLALNAYRNWLGFDYGTLLTSTVYVVQASDTVKPSADNTFRVAIEYRNSAATSPVLGGTAGYDVYSVSGMWDWQLTPKVSFTNAVRFDYLTLNYSGNLVPGTGFTVSQYNNISIPAWSFNSGLVYKVTDLDTVRLTAARGLQLPSLVDFALESPPIPPSIPFAFAGNPTLQPTVVWNLELMYDRGIPSISSTLHSSVFLQRNDDLITPGLSTLPQVLPNGTLTAIAANIGYSDGIGGEIGIKGHAASGFRWNLSYDIMGIRDHTDINKVALTSPQDYQDGTPVSVIIFGGGYTWNNKLEMDLEGRWQSRYTDFRLASTGLTPYYVSDYVTLSARVGYNLTEHMTVAVTAQQFEVSRLVETAGPPVERSIIASLNVHY